MPAAFEAPLAAHHQVIGRWAVSRDASGDTYSRQEAQRRIEQLFNAEVLAILEPVQLVNLRVVAFSGGADLPPALAVICDDMGALDLGWIQKTNALSDTMFGSVAPVDWRGTAYKALEQTLGYTLPIFTYVEFIDEIANYLWYGETDDDGARKALELFHGTEEDEEVIAAMLPSAMHARRPDFMLIEKPTALKHLPTGLAKRLRRLRDTHKALQDLDRERTAWRYDHDLLSAYRPETYDYSTLPPLTLVPFNQFAAELDDIARHGMEAGFMDTAGIATLQDATSVGDWFASLKLGVDYLVAVQDLIAFDPTGR